MVHVIEAARRGPTARPRTVLLAMALGVLLAAVTYASMRVSANYTVVIDELTGGGGSASSASFSESDSAVGQACLMTPASSASYAEHGGVIQPVAVSPVTRVGDWRVLDAE